MVKVIKVFNKGKENLNCNNHDFVYNFPRKTFFTHPAKHDVERICSECGKHEFVHTDENIKFDEDNFFYLKEKFNIS